MTVKPRPVLPDPPSRDMFSDAPVEITIDGQDYAVTPITHGNLCSALRWMKSQWMQDFLAETRRVNLPSEERGATLAQIACRTPTLDQLFDDFEAKLYLLSLQVTCNGTKLRFEHIRDQMAPRTQRELGDILYGISRKEAPEPVDPLPQTDSTSTTEI